MSLQVNNTKALQKKGEVDAMAWQNYAIEKLVVLEIVIQEDMMQQKDELPSQLLKIADVILKTLSSINSLKNHRKDFERLLGVASTLVITLWQLYIDGAKYRSLGWPPPKLRNLLDELVDTTSCIHKLMGRKSEKNPAKRVLLGCFGIRDLGKFNKYQQRLCIMALRLQNKPHNINIHAVLLAVVHSRAQPQHQDSDAELEGDLSGKSAKKKAADKKPTVEGSRLREEGRSTSFKLANQRVKSEEDSQRKSSNSKNEAKDNSKYERDEERSADDKPPRRRMDKRTNGNEEARDNQGRGKTIRYEPDGADLVEGISALGSRSGSTAQSKTRKKPNQVYEDDENIRGRASKRKSRSVTNPVTPQTQGPPAKRPVSIPFANESGIMINENIGNTFNVTTSG